MIKMLPVANTVWITVGESDRLNGFQRCSLEVLPSLCNARRPRSTAAPPSLTWKAGGRGFMTDFESNLFYCVSIKDDQSHEEVFNLKEFFSSLKFKLCTDEIT